MFKSTKGSVTFMAYAAMLFFALYIILICSNGARKYKVQSEAIDVVTEVYTINTPNEEIEKVYFENGGKKIEVD